MNRKNNPIIRHIISKRKCSIINYKPVQPLPDDFSNPKNFEASMECPFLPPPSMHSAQLCRIHRSFCSGAFSRE